MLILNAGGTFNKRYDPLEGRLVVPQDNHAIETLIRRCDQNVAIRGLIYKDSLAMDERDRAQLAQAVLEAYDQEIIIVHGTDTMTQSAAAVDRVLVGDRAKRVVLIGAMVPFSIDPVESSIHLGVAIGAIAHLKPGVYIGMHGWIKPWDQVRKDRAKGCFVSLD